MKSVFTLLMIAAVNCLPAATNTENASEQICVATTEIEQLTLILTKYGNNPYGMPTLPYAILQNDEAAREELIPLSIMTRWVN